MNGKFPTLRPRIEQKKCQRFFSSKDDYEKQLKQAQTELLKLQNQLHLDGRKMIIIFEGHDAAGKGGVIRRIAQYLDPRGIIVHAIGKPNVVEIHEHYFQRFFQRLPQPGAIAVFDRSWYGRVLVERVEKIISPKTGNRAYGEILAVEKMLRDDGVLVLKYLLDISHEEQRKRFKERMSNPLKAWKLTEEDLRNRKKWNIYHAAYKAMLRKTSIKQSPWKVVPADSKWFARVFIANDIAATAKKHFNY